MRYVILILVLALCSVTASAQEQSLPTKEQYCHQRITQEMALVGALLDEVARLRAENLKLKADIASRAGRE